MSRGARPGTAAARQGLTLLPLNPISSLTTVPPEAPECRLSTNQGRGKPMDRPLTNQRPYTVTNLIGGTCKETPANEISVDLSLSLSLDQSYEGLQHYA